MPKPELISPTWGGQDTASDAIEALDQRKDRNCVAAKLHHALSRRLYSEADVADPEGVDVIGGMELIHTLAFPSGLEAITGLAEPLARCAYRLQLRSPTAVQSLLRPDTASSATISLAGRHACSHKCLVLTADSLGKKNGG